VRIADHVRNARKGRHLTRGTLGIAARDNDFAVGIATPDAPYGRTGVLFGGSSYCAGIKDYVISPSRGGGAVQPGIPELLLDGRPVGLGRAATEIFYVKAGHAHILAYIQHSLRETPDRKARVFLRFR